MVWCRVVLRQAGLSPGAARNPVAIAGYGDAMLNDVRDYGAAGDDVTDCRAAIQAAIDDAVVHHKGGIFIPAGTYRVSRATTIPGTVAHRPLCFAAASSALPDRAASLAAHQLPDGTNSPGVRESLIVTVNDSTRVPRIGCLRRCTVQGPC